MSKTKQVTLRVHKDNPDYEKIMNFVGSHLDELGIFDVKKDGSIHIRDIVTGELIGKLGPECIISVEAANDDPDEFLKGMKKKPYTIN